MKYLIFIIPLILLFSNCGLPSIRGNKSNNDTTLIVAKNIADSIIYIDIISVYTENSLGGRDIEISWYNASEKNIDSITFYVYGIDEFGNICKSDNGKDETAKLTDNGIETITYHNSYWGMVWFNMDIIKIKIYKIIINYTDGSVLVYIPEDNKKGN